jgi:chromosome segregation ATPase
MTRRSLFRFGMGIIFLLVAALLAAEFYALLGLRLRTAEEEIERSHRLIRLLNDRLHTLREEQNTRQTQLAETLSALRTLEAASDPALHHRLRGEIARLSEINLRLEAERETIREESDQRRQALATAEAGRQRLEAALLATSNEVARLRASEQTLRERMVALERERNEARNETAQTRKELAQTQEAVRALEGRVAAEENHRRQAESRAAALEKRIADLEEELRTLRAPPAPPVPGS